MLLTMLIPLLALGQQSMKAQSRTYEASLNGLAITLDAESGSILRLRYGGIEMLRAMPGRASILDLATPIPKFEPLRVASRFSKGVRIEGDRRHITVHWDRLGMSRDWTTIGGDVSATVTLAAAPDGGSVILSAEIHNGSQTPVRQVLFPDFHGLLPFAGVKDTTFRTSAFGMQPFVQLAADEEARVYHYVQPQASGSVTYTSGGRHLSDMVVRWMDFGGLKGGLSLFPRRWGWEPELPVMLQHSEVDRKLRLMVLHAVFVQPGETWRSGEFWLTPHTGGWAKGIEPYRTWARSHFTREWPVPKHVREGLGFRTVWMSQYQPDDPKDPVYRFKDLPSIARESKEHGLDELVFWSFRDDLIKPGPDPYPRIGSMDDLRKAAADCRKLGVNAVPFVGQLAVGRESAARYGVAVPGNGAWTYHSELVPRTMSGYASAFANAQIGSHGKLWADDVIADCRHFADLGLPSICFDQFLAQNVPPPNMHSVGSAIRGYAKKIDPESTLSGEELSNWELDANALDYTWNWGPYKGKDYRPLTSVYAAPRMNYCIDSSALNVKKGFADNLYLCIMPRKPESTNGSAPITAFPVLSKALKQCAALRKRYLRYFVEGTLIGECLLAAPCPAHVSAYVLPDRVLMVVVNDGPSRPLRLKLDLAAWLGSPSGRYQMTEIAEDGKALGSRAVTALGPGTTGKLKAGEMRVFEFRLP